MSPEMRVALWITLVGSTVLFGSLAALVGLMYVLTSGWLFTKDERPERPMKKRRSVRRRLRRQRVALEPEPVPAHVEPRQPSTQESERRRQAVAIAVAIAVARAIEGPLFDDGPSDWRVLHRARRLSSGMQRRSPL